MRFYTFRVGRLLQLKSFRVLAYLGLSRWERIRTKWTPSFAGNHDRSSVVLLDHVLEINSSLNQLLNNPASLNQYYHDLRTYFGRDKFPREAFDSICAQLRKILDSHPDFGRALWRARSNRETFWIDSLADSAGRTLNKKLWRVYWRDYTLRIEQEAFSPKVLSADSLRKITGTLRTFASTVEKYQSTSQTLSSLSRKRQAELNRIFFMDATSQPELRQAIHSVIARFFALPENQQIIHLADADLLIYFLRELRQKPDRILTAIPDCPCPAGLLGAIRACLPNISRLLDDTDLFPPKKVSDFEGHHREAGRTRSSEWGTMLLHPLHSLWLGIAGNDCLGGNSDSLTPARWLIGATQGTRTHVIERDGMYQGFVRSVHVRGPDGNNYGSLELWSPVFIKNLLVRDKGSSQGYRSRPFFDVWFPLYADDSPKNWRGFVFSESKLIDNFGIKNVFKYSSFCRDFPFEALARQFSLIDQKLDLIARENVNTQICKTYGEGLIFDAQIQDAGMMRLLDIT